eukprot:7386194-Prymnesium_polylepis.1
MKSNFKAYDVDLVEQGVTASASGSAGVTKGKAASEVMLPMRAHEERLWSDREGSGAMKSTS